MNLTRLIRGASATLALAMAAFTASAAPTTQLGFLIDASGSIGTSNFTTMKNGYAAALGALPTDGSIEVTIYSFSTGTVQVLAPTVVTGASIGGIISAVNGMAYTAGTTHTADGINAIAAAMLGSANYSAQLRSIINIATDGVPNGNTQAQTIAAATSAQTRGIDAMTAEAIGAGLDVGFLQDIVFSPVKGVCTNCGVVLPGVGSLSDPMTSDPWILRVNTFADFEDAITAKVKAITNQVPEPGSVALVAIALLAAGGQARRSRKA
ncbi:vWA domain-containing protein [Roseateles sp.]|uniref:vWA domain-containing protein n=1 Tax=Roseateles sp. TaxID=1971397 RepID=UPI0039528117